jgi:hypothetical protein
MHQKKLIRHVYIRNGDFEGKKLHRKNYSLSGGTGRARAMVVTS